MWIAPKLTKTRTKKFLLRVCLLFTQRAEDKQVFRLKSIVKGYLLTVLTFSHINKLKLAFMVKRVYLIDNFLEYFQIFLS